MVVERTSGGMTPPEPGRRGDDGSATTTDRPRRMRARELAVATPASRDRYVDLLRAVSICVVVLGHWTVGAFTVADDALGGVNLLSVETWTHPLTWVFQVMPVFFLVGGYASAASLDGLHRRGGGVVAWERRRALRLLRPTAVLLGVLVVTRLVAPPLGADPQLVLTATWAASAPLWFLVVYLAVVALAPLAVAAHRRWGLWALAALVAGVVVGDVLRIVTGDGRPAAASYLLAWLAVHQAGIAWHEGALPRTSRAAWGLVVGGLLTTVLLTGPGPYGVAMVGEAVAGDLTNTAPPTVALLTLATAQTGGVLLLRAPANRWLQRPRAWTAVIGVNAVVLTLFLWHMAALVVAALALAASGVFPQPDVGSGEWFVLRIPWIAACTLVLMGLVAVMRRWEAPVAADSAARPSPVAVVAGIGAVLAGLTSLGVSGTRGLGPTVAGIPPVEVALIAVGLLVLSRAGAGIRGPRRDARG